MTMRSGARRSGVQGQPWTDHSLIQHMAALKSILQGVPVDLKILSQQCLLLSKILDSLVANNRKPSWRNELLPLIKQLCAYKNNPDARPALLVLLLSVKSAFRQEWLSSFPSSDKDEIFTTLKSFFDSLTTGHEVAGQASLSPLQCGGSALNSREPIDYLRLVSHRFYPRLKMNDLFVAVEAKAGYEVLMCDFHVPHMNIQDRVRLYVGKKDLTTSATCLITPKDVNMLVNGKQVERRVTTGYLDVGPQMPSDVTRLVKVGANVLQVIGEFSVPYIIAVTSARPIECSAKNTHLSDYVTPLQAANEVNSTDVDDEVVEGDSRVSLRCPVSHQRLVTPVKAQTCRHLQCFDYDSFLEINEKRPAWRCPCCNRDISCPDLRIDRQMEKVLKETDEKVFEVIMSQDGSWIPVFAGEDQGTGGPDVIPIDGGEAGADVIDLTDVADDEPNRVKHNARDFEQPERKADVLKTLEAISRELRPTSQVTNPTTRQRENVEQLEISNIPDITASASQNSQWLAGPSWTNRNDGVYLTTTEGIVASARTVTNERQVHNQTTLLAPVVQALPAPNYLHQFAYLQPRAGFHVNSPSGPVNSLASSSGYMASTQLPQPHSGVSADTGLANQESLRINLLQLHYGLQSPGVSQNGQDHAQGRQQWQGAFGAPLHQPVTSAAPSQSLDQQSSQQFFSNQSPLSFTSNQVQSLGITAQQLPAVWGSSGWRSTIQIPAQTVGDATTSETNWRPAIRMRGSISPMSIGRGVGQTAPSVQQRVTVGSSVSNSAAIGFNTATNGNPSGVVSGPQAGQPQMRLHLQANPTGNISLYNGSRWVSAPEFSSPTLYTSSNTEEGWIGFDSVNNGINSHPQ